MERTVFIIFFNSILCKKHHPFQENKKSCDAFADQDANSKLSCPKFGSGIIINPCS